MSKRTRRRHAPEQKAALVRQHVVDKKRVSEICSAPSRLAVAILIDRGVPLFAVPSSIIRTVRPSTAPAGGSRHGRSAPSRRHESITFAVRRPAPTSAALLRFTA